MDDTTPPQPIPRGVNNALEIDYPAAGAMPSSTKPLPTFPTSTSRRAYEHVQKFHHMQQQQQQQKLQAFWQAQASEVQQTTDFKNHCLPLARIKKIVKADDDVRMISAEAPVLFAKACEMFILELTTRSLFHTEANKRRTLQKGDIVAAITKTDMFDFLVDIVPRDDMTSEESEAVNQARVVAMQKHPEVAYMWPQIGEPSRNHELRDTTETDH